MSSFIYLGSLDDLIQAIAEAGGLLYIVEGEIDALVACTLMGMPQCHGRYLWHPAISPTTSLPFWMTTVSRAFST